MTKEELKDKYTPFIAEVSKIMGLEKPTEVLKLCAVTDSYLGKPIDILKFCETIDSFFRPLEKRIGELENENSKLKEKENTVHTLDVLHKEAVRKYDEANAQLTKAKEIIRTLYFIIQGKIYYENNIQIKDSMDLAKAFLNEVK